MSGQGFRHPKDRRKRFVHLLRETAIVAAVIAVLAGVSTTLVNWQFILNLDFRIVGGYVPALIRGLSITVGLTLSTMIVATFLGMLLAIVAGTHLAWLRFLIVGAVEVFRSVPILITLFWIHFALPIFTGVSMHVLVSGLIAMMLQATAFMTEVMRAGIAAVPSGQMEAGRSLGLSSFMRWRLVVLPQALFLMLPSITNVLASMLKASAILSALSVEQLWQVAQQIGSYTFKPIEALSIAALIYFVIGKLLIFAMNLLEARLSYPR